MFAEIYDDASEIERTFINIEDKNYTWNFANDKGIIVGHIIDFVSVNKKIDYTSPWRICLKLIFIRLTAIKLVKYIIGF